MNICKIPKFAECFHIFYVITQIIFSLLSYVPCASYLFIATCVRCQVQILLFVLCFLSNFLKINFKDPFHLKDAVLGWAIVLGSYQCWGILLLWHMVGQGGGLLAKYWLTA